ncbi:MAG: LapA family protein [Saprospirales bacterium]|nr:LapA family protein [Saprospirales bacterium]
MEFLKTLFASFDQAESLIFMAFVLIAFLIGFVLSWLVWTRQARKWRLEAQQSKAELKALQAEYQSFKDQFSLREADIQHAQVEAEESKRRMMGAQEDRSRIAAELEEAHAELARLQSSVAAQQVTIEDLNDQILGLRTKNETLVRRVHGDNRSSG